jgi:hypothetical protein
LCTDLVPPTLDCPEWAEVAAAAASSSASIGVDLPDHVEDSMEVAAGTVGLWKEEEVRAQGMSFHVAVVAVVLVGLVAVVAMVHQGRRVALAPKLR